MSSILYPIVGKVCEEPNKVETYDFDSAGNFEITDQTDATAEAALKESDDNWENPEPANSEPSIILTPKDGQTTLLQLEFKTTNAVLCEYTLELPNGQVLDGNVSMLKC